MIPKRPTTKRPVRSKDSIIKNAPDNVTLTCTFSGLIFASMAKYQASMGFPSTQDVARIAVARFLKTEGFIK